MNASIESATSCSYPSIRQFLISDTRVYLEATQHFEGEEDSGVKGEGSLSIKYYYSKYLDVEI